MLGLISTARLLDDTPDIPAIVQQYIKHKLTPSTPDAIHLAIASFYAIDFVLTWNCTHLANANKFRHMQVINDRLGLRTPMIVTPLTLITEDTHEDPG